VISIIIFLNIEMNSNKRGTHNDEIVI